MTTRPTNHNEQPQLPLELRVPALAPAWAAVIEHETEGDQDTGWWDA